MRQHFTEEQANAILRRAVERMPMKDEMSREQLEKIAAEIGVTPEALRKAEEDWENEQADLAERRLYVQQRRRGFRRHLMAYLIGNLALVGLAAGAPGGEQGAAVCMTSLVGWGIGLAFHASAVLRTRGDDFEARYTHWLINRRARQLAEEELGKMLPRSR